MKPTTKRRQNRQRHGMEIVEDILARRPALGDEATVRRLVDEALGSDPEKATAAMDRLNWHDAGEDSPTPIRQITDDRGEVVAFGRTKMGQAAYDVLCSSMSGAEVVRRHPEVTRDFVLKMRQKYSKLRRRK